MSGQRAESAQRAEPAQSAQPAQRADPGELRAQMTARLAAEPYLVRWTAALAPWWPALAAVPRHEFIPDTVWLDPDHPGPGLRPLHRADDPDRWLALAYGDDPVITQVDDGYPVGPGLAGRMPTSSASSPVMVAVMLAALDAQPGHRVCEIGTGTGYNAALLAHRLGTGHITSIEIDPGVAAHARRALAATGYAAVCVVTGDGAQGYPPRAPYDRIVATAAVHRIPYPWIAQTRPGGRVLLPWATSFTEALVELTVDEQGSARGRIVGESSFMCVREQRQWRGSVAAVVGEHEKRAAEHAETSVTSLHPYWVSGDPGARFAIAQRVPDCQWRYWPYDEQDGEGVLWLLDFTTGSWAKLTHTTPDASDAEFRVRQHGPRRLWEEVDAAHSWWVGQGRPGTDRWRFTLTPEGQRIELVQPATTT